MAVGKVLVSWVKTLKGCLKKVFWLDQLVKSWEMQQYMIHQSVGRPLAR